MTDSLFLDMLIFSYRKHSDKYDHFMRWNSKMQLKYLVKSSFS